MLNKIKYDDDRGWSIAFARCASKRNKIQTWSYSVSFQGLIVLPASEDRVSLLDRLCAEILQPDERLACYLISEAEKTIREAIPDCFTSCSMRQESPRWAMVSLAGLPEFGVPISKAEEVIGEYREILTSEAVQLVREAKNVPIPDEVSSWFEAQRKLMHERADKYNAMIAKMQEAK